MATTDPRVQEILAKLQRDSERETMSDGDQIACPVCHEAFGDLYEYSSNDEGEHEIECPHCDEPILLRCVVSIDYTAIPDDKRAAERAAKGGA
jgi:DNA-directed RNA polymerase subunit RPC12/RpoP